MKNEGEAVVREEERPECGADPRDFLARCDECGGAIQSTDECICIYDGRHYPFCLCEECYTGMSKDTLLEWLNLSCKHAAARYAVPGVRNLYDRLNRRKAVTA